MASTLSPSEHDDADVANYADTLAEDGIVTVEGYLDADTCDDLRLEIETLLERPDLARTRPDDDYEDHIARGEPVLKERSGEWDDGMLELFNTHLAVPEVERIEEDAFVNDIIDAAAGEPYSPDTLNTYVNRSITETRGYHADTYGGKFKSFVYLSDVPDESFGPFSYVPGSHEPGRIRRKLTTLVNRVRDRPATDAVFADTEDAITCTAPKGTLVIANQAGLHRGMPQEPGRERVLVTTSYTPDESA